MSRATARMIVRGYEGILAKPTHRMEHERKAIEKERDPEDLYRIPNLLARDRAPVLNLC